MPASSALLQPNGPETSAFKKAVLVSLLLHFTALFGMVYSPSLRLDPKQTFKAIDVDLVAPQTPRQPKPRPVAPAKKVQPPRPRPVTKKNVAVRKPAKAVPVRQSKVGIKRSLKNKTYKPEKAIDSALDRLARHVEKEPPKTDPVKAAIEQIRRKAPQKKNKVDTDSDQNKKNHSADTGGSSVDKERKNIYMHQVALAIQEKWAYSEQMAGGDQGLITKIVIKVLPNGVIDEHWFTERSLNTYLNTSAINAIQKANPVLPHPPGIKEPFITITLGFTPSGLE
ncbi:MAG: hypothetical protein CSA22_04915 [Deltaproteobacteria bacterium]|nr:MAG: hypothetical protein CSA22_04915 [Deltaproteobacteria bacterium]